MKHNFTALWWIFSFLSRQIKGVDTTVGSKINAQLTRAIQISQLDFKLNSSLPMGTSTWFQSRIECGAKFLAAKENDNSSSVNSFYFDNDSKTCQMGTVTSSVEEINNGGIFVSGVSEF